MNRQRTSIKKIKQDYQAKKLANPFFRKKEKKPERLFLRRFKLVSLLLLTAFLFWFFTCSSWWKITEVEVRGLERLNTNLIKTELASSFESKSILIFKQQNIFLFNKDASAERLKSKFNLADIKIKKRWPRKLIVEINERPYAFIYYEEGKYYFSSADNYLMTEITFQENEPEEISLITKTRDASALGVENGELIDISETEREELSTSSLKANIIAPDASVQLLEGGNLNNGLGLTSISPSEKEKYFIIENKNNDSLIRSDGKIKLSEKYLAFIFNLNGELKLYNFQLDRFIIADQYYNSVFAKILDGPQIYFNVNNEIKGQLDNLMLVKNNKIKDNFNRLEYIDLRYGDKIYFYPENITEPLSQ
ncbi:FtsQ-type POTRA domain-containing protein [Candidatus Falkowbacteria bacterium]|nr:FtsQ-type POTRA domain-containing protein [Candidatus Falkowbacteria bacterium]